MVGFGLVLEQCGRFFTGGLQNAVDQHTWDADTSVGMMDICIECSMTYE